MTDKVCQFLIVACMDFRFQDAIYEHFHKMNHKDLYDRVEIAGGVKDVDYVLKQVDMSVALHKIEKVYLVNHEDCGAYAGADFETHKKDLTLAAQKILDKYPELEVEGYFLRLNKKFEKVGS